MKSELQMESMSEIRTSKGNHIRNATNTGNMGSLLKTLNSNRESNMIVLKGKNILPMFHDKTMYAAAKEYNIGQNLQYRNTLEPDRKEEQVDLY